MMDKPNQPIHPRRMSVSRLIKNSIIVKLVFIGFIILLLMIPNAMVRDLIRERQNLKRQVKNEISHSWGAEQIITGPILIVPYRTKYKQTDGKFKETIKNLHILPDELDITGRMEDEVRKRNNFEVVLYQSDLQFQGHFQSPNWQELQLNTDDIIWDKAWIVFGVTDLTGIKSQPEIQLGHKSYEMQSGTDVPTLLPQGLHTKVQIDLSTEKKIPFSLDIKLNGTAYLGFTPIGKKTTASVASSWNAPSFRGKFLRDTYETGSDGFSATWTIFDLNRNFPQTWIGSDKYHLQNHDFGVELIQQVNSYKLNTRSGKYALFVIALTFLIFFFFEIIGRHHLHPFQYLLVGLAISIFYLLLLSLSEHIGFNRSYWVAAAAVILLITMYSRFILANFQRAGLLALLLVVIYGFIFVVLQLKSYALLVGSIGLFLVLGLVMYLSRNVNWFGDES